MIVPKHTTTVETKEKHIDNFFSLIRDQMTYGGTKYAADECKEATDVITENYGVEWALGTMNKYLLRYKNLQRERDLLKIAGYCFIVWLQMGYHLEEHHDCDTWNEGEKETK